MKALRLLTLLLAMALIGCGGSAYEHKWSAAVGTKSAGFPAAWEGKWKSTRREGSEGKIRCIVDPSADKVTKAHFAAEYHGFKAYYTVPLDGMKEKGKIRMAGIQPIGGLGSGVYHYSAWLSQKTFDGYYSSLYDSGIFELKPAGR